jgi:hypothetical protein
MDDERPIARVLESAIEGIRYDVDWDQYRQFLGANPSVIVHGLRSMKHLRYAWSRPSNDTPSLIWGRAVHCLLFEPAEFVERYVKCTIRRDARTEAYKDFLAENAGKEILTVAEYDSACFAAQSFVGNEEVQDFIHRGKPEVTLLTVEDGVQCKGRVDWLASFREALVDLKTTKNIEARRASSDFYRYHYDVKLGLYQRWLQKLTGRNWPVEVIWLENTPPYDVAVMPIDNAVLDRGAAKGLGILRKLKECIADEHWPGVADDEYLLHTPNYEMEDVELEGAEEYQEAA